MLTVLGEQLLLRKCRKTVHQFDKRGTLPNAVLMSETQYQFFIKEGPLTFHIDIERVGEIYYVFSLTVVKTLLENVGSTVFTETMQIHSFSWYGALVSSMAYIEENVKMFAAMR